MERSYFCFDQVLQLQATQDCIVMLKLLHDSGCDMKKEPIHFVIHNSGDQVNIFNICIRRLFKDTQTDTNRDDYGEEVLSYTIPIPELELYMGSLRDCDRLEHTKMIEEKLNVYCDYGDAGMEGKLVGYNLEFKIEGPISCCFSKFLKGLVEIKTMIQRKNLENINRLKCTVLIKMVHEKLGMTYSLGFDGPLVVFHSLMSELKVQVPFQAGDLSFETMRKTLSEALDMKLFLKGAGAA